MCLRRKCGLLPANEPSDVHLGNPKAYPDTVH